MENTIKFIDLFCGLGAFHEADTGLVVMDGKLIEKPVIREMQRIVSIANKLKIEI